MNYKEIIMGALINTGSQSRKSLEAKCQAKIQNYNADDFVVALHEMMVAKDVVSEGECFGLKATSV